MISSFSAASPTAAIGRVLLALAFLYPFTARTEEVPSFLSRSDGATPASIVSETFQPGCNPVVLRPALRGDRFRRDDGRGTLIWSTADADAIADHISISNDGAWVAIGYTLNSERLEVRNGSSGALEFAYPVESGGSWTAISEDGFNIAYAAMDSVWLFTRQLRDHPFMRFGMDGYSAGPVALSADGVRLIATGLDPDGQTNRVWCFNRREGVGQPVWTFDVDADESFGWYGATVTPDGALVVVNGKFYLYALDGTSGEVVWEVPTYNTESPIALSGDGSILVTSSLTGRLRAFARSQDGFEELWHYNFSGALSSWVSACAVSGDGRTIAAGTLDFQQNGYQGRLALFDTFGGGRPNWIAEPLADVIGAIAVSQNGGVIAAVTWGDLDHETADLVIFERHNSRPFYRLTTDGSLNAVSISDNGLRVAASGKATHNRVFGRGGQAHVIDIGLLGALVNGQVRRAGGGTLPNVLIYASQNPYTAVTDAQGRYSLRVEAAAQRNINVCARKPGFSYASQAVVVAPDRVTDNVNFTLDAAGDPPVNLRASQGSRNQITLAWQGYNDRRVRCLNPDWSDVQVANGEPIQPATLTGDPEPYRPFGRDDGDEADSIRIYRGYLSRGPYQCIGSVSGDEDRFVDRVGLFPGRNYFYVITADFGDGESAYSAEATGWLDDSFLIWDADLSPMARPPNLDGEINDDEWAGAEVRDVSDILGYDNPDSAGTVSARIAFSDADDHLYLAFSFYGRRELQEGLGVGVYVDDDGNGRWSTQSPGSEGNYWGYYRNGGPDMRYRSLTGEPYASDPYYQFRNPTLAFRDVRGWVEIEMGIPLGFRGTQEIALHSPEKVIGLGLFVIQRDEAGNPIFNGWWPQDMFSIVTEPQQFARVHIPADLVVPPGPPRDLDLSRDGDDLSLVWTDPDTAIDGAELQNWDGVNVYRNGCYIASVGTGRQTYLDDKTLPGGWYEYSLTAYVNDRNLPFEGPRSASVGAYASRDPEVQELAWDDGQPEAFYVVGFQGEDNRFAVRFDIPGLGYDTLGVYWFDFFHRGSAEMIIYIMTDEAGAPGEVVAPRLRVKTNSQTDFQRFRFPGVDQPRLNLEPDAGGSIWAVLNYLAATPGSPAIGVDNSNADGERNLYYTASEGWRQFQAGQPMIRIAYGVALPSDDAGGNPTLHPRAFLVQPNFPNPFNGETVIPFALPGDSRIFFDLFDAQGKLVWRADAGFYRAGQHRIPLMLDWLPSGAYHIRVSSTYGIIGRQVQLIK